MTSVKFCNCQRQFCEFFFLIIKPQIEDFLSLIIENGICQIL